jgi:uncharacterized protein
MSTQTPTQSFAETPAQTVVPTHAINWFEIPCENLDRATTFYETILGAKMHRQPGQQAGRGSHPQTRSEPMSIFATDPAGTGGMLVKRSFRRPGRGGALVYLNCDGILDAVLARVRQAGGLILMPKTPVPGGRGYFACLRDSEGNHIGLHSH